MKNIKLTGILEKFDVGMFSYCLLLGFLCVGILGITNNSLADSFVMAAFIAYPFVAAERGFIGFLLNGVLGQFSGVVVTLLLLSTKGVRGLSEFFVQYIYIVAITIILGTVAWIIYISAVSILRGSKNKTES